jgi:hypothetical protein
MMWIERSLVIAILCILTGVGWQIGTAPPQSHATTGLVSVRSGSVSTRSSSSSTRRFGRRRVYVGGGFHGGK